MAGDVITTLHINNEYVVSILRRFFVLSVRPLKLQVLSDLIPVCVDFPRIAIAARYICTMPGFYRLPVLGFYST